MNYNPKPNRKSISGGMSRKSFNRKSFQRKSISNRSYIPGPEELDDLPNDKLKLEEILNAKTRHLTNMKKMLENAENDAFENEMIFDERELNNKLGELEQRNKELNEEIKEFPNKYFEKKEQLKTNEAFN